MVPAYEGNIIGETRLYVIVARLTPAIQPIDIGRCSRHARPTSGPRDRAKVIVLREELRCGVIECRSLQSFSHAGAGNESFGVVTHAKIELVDDTCADDSRPAR